MWEKAAFLSYFAGLCLAQRAAVADMRARQAASPTVIVINGLPSNAVGSLASFVQALGQNATQTLLVVPPAGTQAASIVIADGKIVPKQASSSPQQFAPGASPLPSGVFTSVLFPDVPTVAPTGVAVPTIYTYTGTFNPSLVPSGYSFVTPPVVPTSVPESLPTSPPSISHSLSIPQTTSIPSMVTTTRPFTHSSLTTSKPSTTSATSSISTTSSTSSTSTTSSTATTSSSSSTSSASKTSSTIGSATNGQNTRPQDPPHPTTALSGRAIAGVVAGILCAFLLLAALLVVLWQRRKSRQPPPSPGIYPQEAYLYDPPITPPPTAGARGSPGNSSLDRSATPEMESAETRALLGGAVAGTAVGAGVAARRNKRVTLTDPGPDPTPIPSRWRGYSPVESTDIAEEGRRNPFADPAEEYRDDVGQLPASENRWPLNPRAESGLGSPPGSSSGPSSYPPVPGSSSPSTHVGGVGAGAGSAHMREVRRAWGWDQ